MDPQARRAVRVHVLGMSRPVRSTVSVLPPHERDLQLFLVVRELRGRRGVHLLLDIVVSLLRIRELRFAHPADSMMHHRRRL